MDGVKGFEPLNAGTRNQSLTAWRHPKIMLSYRVSNELSKNFSSEILSLLRLMQIESVR